MSRVASIDLSAVPRGRCKNTDCVGPEFSRDTAATNSTFPAGWCAQCGHSHAMHACLEYLSKQIISNFCSDYMF